MKRTISALVLLALFLTSTTTVLGQKGRSFAEKSLDGRFRQAAVVFSNAEALTDGSGVLIRWTTEQEKDNLGFYVFRVDGGDRTIVANKFITGSGIKYRGQIVSGEEYSIYDRGGQINSRYVIESFERGGNRTSTQSFFPKFTAGLVSEKGRVDNLWQGGSEESGIIETNRPAYAEPISTEMEGSFQVPDPATQRWVAAQPGVRIGVRGTGMYRVTKAQLQAAGLNVSDPSLWQVYVDGVEQRVIVGPNGDYLDFYGKGIDRVESDTRIYYVVVGQQPGLRMGESIVRPSTGTVLAANFDQTVTLKGRSSYLTDIFNGDEENYVGHLVSSSSTSVDVTLAAVDPSVSTAVFTARFLGYSPTPHAVNVTINGYPVGQATGNGIGQFISLTAEIPTSFLVEGTNAVGMVTTSGTDYGFFDQLQITYKRRHVTTNNLLPFPMQNRQGAKLEGFSTANIRVFDVTNDGNPAQISGAVITQNGSTYEVLLNAYRTRAMYAVEDTALLTPFSIAPNVPSSLATIDHNANLVIISHRNFLAEANAWKQYRAAQGVMVEVVDVEDVYDEFNFGVLSANSITAFLNYAKTSWQTPPQYVLLIGDGSYDSRNYEGTGYWNLVPIKLVDTVYMETASDDALTDFNNDGLADISIGRIPARTSAMVTNALNKTATFETLSTTQNLSRGVIFAYDNPIGWNFQVMSEIIRDQLPTGTTSVMVGRSDPNANATLISQMNNGRYVANYAGHGSAGSWASSSFFHSNHVPQLTNINAPIVYTMLTCLNGYFHNVGFESLSERLLNSSAGGAAASWASTGETTPDIQQFMATRFFQQLGAGSITRLGDLARDAKAVVPGGRDVRLSWTIIGDPMLKMR